MTEFIFRNARMDTGRLIVEIPPEHRGAVMNFLRTKKDKPYALTIKEHKKKRSNEANAKLWALINEQCDYGRNQTFAMELASAIECMLLHLFYHKIFL